MATKIAQPKADAHKIMSDRLKKHTSVQLISKLENDFFQDKPEEKAEALVILNARNQDTSKWGGSKPTIPTAELKKTGEKFVAVHSKEKIIETKKEVKSKMEKTTKKEKKVKEDVVVTVTATQQKEIDAIVNGDEKSKSKKIAAIYAIIPNSGYISKLLGVSSSLVYCATIRKEKAKETVKQ